MLRGIHSVFFVCIGIISMLLTGSAMGYGKYAGTIDLPLTPFGLTYIPESASIVVTQYMDGQAGQFNISSPTQAGNFEPMFSPISEGYVAGIAWCSAEDVLYWLNEKDTSQGSTYKLLRSESNGWALAAGPDVLIEPGTLLGDITYVPDLDAFCTVNITTDEYLFINRQTGEILPQKFISPTQHPDAKISYGLGLDYSTDGHLDLLVGHITDQRAIRVMRRDLDGSPTAIEFSIAATAQSTPGWPTGIVYCDAGEQTFTAVADAFTSALFLYDTPHTITPGVTSITSSVESTSIGNGEETESIIAHLSWENESDTFDSIYFELYNAETGAFDIIEVLPGDSTSATHAINREGLFTYRLTPYTGGEEGFISQTTINTSGASVVRKANLDPVGGDHALPIAVTSATIEGETHIFAAEIKPFQSSPLPIVHRLRHSETAENGLEELAAIASPFNTDTQIIGLAWDGNNSELVWLGSAEQGRVFKITRTTADGEPASDVFDLSGNPFPQDDLSDIAFDPTSTDESRFYTAAVDHHTLFSFNREGMCSGETIPLPQTLPGSSDQWGLVSGLSIITGLHGTPVFYSILGIIPADEWTPQQGEGYARMMVAMEQNLESGMTILDTPIDISYALDSALIRGFSIEQPQGHNLNAIVAAQDLGYLYEIALFRDAPLFMRGDVNMDHDVNLSDAIGILNYLFKDETEPGCLDTADANDSGSINIADALCLLRVSFGMSDSDCLAYPFNVCGTDPATDTISCLNYEPCN